MLPTKYFVGNSNVLFSRIFL